MEKLGNLMKNQGLVSATALTVPSTPEYNCPICKDSYVVHPKIDGKVDYSQTIPCPCQNTPEARARKAQRLMKYCQLPADTEDRTFENFNAYTPHLKEALKAAKDFRPDGKHKALVIGGKVDIGKSHLAIAVCRTWLELEIPARYVFVPWMLDELRAGQFKEGDESFDRQMSIYETVPMLCLDDLAAETPTPFAREKVTTILQIRWEAGLHTMVTMNKPLDKIPGDDEGRIGSRLRRYAGENIIGIDDCGEYSLRR
jgi:DNA replication protein DnaC